MSVQVWPAVLPRPERPSWQAQPADVRRRTQHDAGPPQYRRRLSGVSRRVTLSVVLTRDQKAVFDRFWAEDCRDGTLHFRMPDPTTDGWPMLTGDGVPMLTGQGVPLLLARTWLCAWGDQPPVETIHAGLHFRMSFGVVVLP